MKTTQIASALSVQPGMTLGKKTSAQKSAQIAAALTVQPKLMQKTPTLEGYAKVGFDTALVDKVVGAGRLAQATGSERKGYDIGVGCAIASADPNVIGPSLSAAERKGFAMSTALYNGMRTVVLPDDINDPIAAFGYWVTHGMAGQPEATKVGIMSSVVTDERAKAGAAAAIEQHGLWYKVKKFFGLTQ